MSAEFTATSSLSQVNRSTAGETTPLARAARAVTRVVADLVTSYRVSRDIRELRGLSDAALRDIGVSRSDIVSLVHQRAYEGVDGRHGQH